MKRLLFCIVFLMSLATSEAQIGVKLAYQNMDAPYWNLFTDPPNTFIKNGYALGLNYSIVGKNEQFVFLPGVQYSRFNKAHFQNRIIGFFQIESLDIEFGSNIYFVKIAKAYTGNHISSNLDNIFLQFTPAISRIKMEFIADDRLDRVYDISLSGRIGLGFDLYLSKNLKVSPSFSYTSQSPILWLGLADYNPTNHHPFFKEESPIKKLSFALRMEFSNQ